MEKEKSESLNIYQKMLKATEKINKVGKNLKVDISKDRSYKAVSEADVLEAVKPIEIELGIYSYPFSRKIIDTNILTTVKEYNGNKTESNQLFLRIETIYRFINVYNPEEYVDITTYGDGLDSGDKATGKGMTYSDKYALLKAYKIETGDDPDKEASPTLKSTKENLSPYDFVEDNNLTEEQIKILVNLDPETKEKIRKKYNKDPLLLNKIEVANLIPSLIQRGLIKTANEVLKDEEEEIF